MRIHESRSHLLDPARCSSYDNRETFQHYFFFFSPLLFTTIAIIITDRISFRCTYELDIHLDRRVVDTHLALTHLVHATWPRFELFILWQRAYIRCFGSRSAITMADFSFRASNDLLSIFSLHEFASVRTRYETTVWSAIRERIGRERRKGL